MRSFKCKNIIGLFLTIALAVLVEMALTFALEPLGYYAEIQRDIKRLQEQGDNVTCVFMGDSSIETGIDPQIFDKAMNDGTITLNAGTGSQTLWGARYYLEDLLKQYPINRVVIGVNYTQLQNNGDVPIKKDLIVLDRIQNPIIYLSAVNCFLKPDEYPYLLKSYRYRDNFSEAIPTINSKIAAFSQVTSVDQDTQMGFAPNSEQFGEGGVGIFSLDGWNINDLDEKAITSLEEMLQMCQERNIETYVLCMPYPSTVLYSSSTIEKAHDLVKGIAKQHQIPFIDLNYMKNRDNILRDEEMNSLEHISAQKTAEITGLIADIIKEQELKPKEESNYLYENFVELRRSMQGIIGIDYHTEPNENGSRTILTDLITNPKQQARYSYWVVQNGEMIWLEQNTENDRCILPKQYIGSDIELTVEATLQDGSRKHRTKVIHADTWTE